MTNDPNSDGLDREGLDPWITGFALLAFLVLAAAMVIPNVVKARTHSAANACVANLKQIEGAKATWALENRKPATEIPLSSDLYGPDKYINEGPACPQGGVYTIGSVEVKPTCSLGGPEHTLVSIQRP